MAKIERFEDLEIWQLARIFARKIYEFTKEGEISKDFRLRDQIRSSAGSIMDNIAEGFERGGNKEFSQFLFIAKGSAGETRSQLYRCFDVGYMNEQVMKEFIGEAELISKKISNFLTYLRGSDLKGYKYRTESDLKP